MSAASAVATAVSDRFDNVRQTLVGLALKPRVEESLIALAVQREDAPTLQLLADTLLYNPNVRRVFIAVRGQAPTIVDATIVTVEGAHRVVAPLAQQKGQRLSLEVGDVGTVRLDQARLRQVLLNVLSNAVKYTPDGGSVTTAMQRHDGSIEITVRDTGVGIAPQDQARVFDDFTRIESGYARTQQGTGLGLSLARRLARLMGGDITLASQPGQGSTVTITIPAA